MLQIAVPEALAGERLDKSLAMLLGISRSDASKLLEADAVRVSGKVMSPSARLEATQKISVIQEAVDALRPKLLPEPEVKISITFEDEHIIVIDKAPDVVVHPTRGHEKGTLVAGLLALFPEIANVGEVFRPGLVHRLDKGTSGLMVVARSQQAYDKLKQVFAIHDLQRQYLAICTGIPKDLAGTIDAPIGRNPHRPREMAVQQDGKEARTHYEVLKPLHLQQDAAADATAPAEAALIRCELETGRTHQIRVHLAAIEHPLLGDERYGQASPLISRPALHSHTLSLLHPITSEPLTFTTPLPDDLKSIVEGKLVVSGDKIS